MSNPTKEADLQLAAFVGVHCSVKTIDHLGEILKKVAKGSVLQTIRFHRTKCTAVVQEVISPSYRDELLKDVGKFDYALIVDEVTDMFTTKFMGVCIRYFSQSRQKMVTDYLGIIKVVSCTGEKLAEALLDYLENEIKMPLSQFHAVGTDGAPAMCGENSFYTH